MNYKKGDELEKVTFIHALMFSDKEDMLKARILNRALDSDYDFFIDMSSFLQNYIFEDFIEDRIRERIRLIINTCRIAVNMEHAVDKRMLEILDRLLRDCNLMDGKRAGVFYRQELAKRKGNKRYLSISDSELDALKPDLFKSLATDYDVAKTHHPSITEEDFSRKYVSHFAKSTHYLESVRALLSLVDSENQNNFNNKVLMVTDYNKRHFTFNREGLELAAQNRGLRKEVLKGK